MTVQYTNIKVDKTQYEICADLENEQVSCKTEAGEVTIGSCWNEDGQMEGMTISTKVVCPMGFIYLPKEVIGTMMEKFGDFYMGKFCVPQ